MVSIGESMGLDGYEVDSEEARKLAQANKVDGVKGKSVNRSHIFTDGKGNRRRSKSKSKGGKAFVSEFEIMRRVCFFNDFVEEKVPLRVNEEAVIERLKDRKFVVTTARQAQELFLVLKFLFDEAFFDAKGVCYVRYNERTLGLKMGIQQDRVWPTVEKLIRAKILKRIVSIDEVVWLTVRKDYYSRVSV